MANKDENKKITYTNEPRLKESPTIKQMKEWWAQREMEQTARNYNPYDKGTTVAATVGGTDKSESEFKNPFSVGEDNKIIVQTGDDTLTSQRDPLDRFIPYSPTWGDKEQLFKSQDINGDNKKRREVVNGKKSK